MKVPFDVLADVAFWISGFSFAMLLNHRRNR